MEEALFLQNIRSALSRYSTEEEGKVLSLPLSPAKAVPELPLEERIKRFSLEVAGLHRVQLFRVTDWEAARKKLAQLLEERGFASAAVTGKDLNPTDSFWKKWGPAQGLAAIEKSEAGVIQADYGLAETGSVVLIASPEKPRIISLLPPICYFVLPVSAMLDSMGQLMVELEDRHGRGEMPSTVNVVTGPSRTADIELSLTVGVHGPGEVHVILVG